MKNKSQNCVRVSVFFSPTFLRSAGIPLARLAFGLFHCSALCYIPPQAGGSFANATALPPSQAVPRLAEGKRGD